jgi:hypothetical protein
VRRVVRVPGPDVGAYDWVMRSGHRPWFRPKRYGYGTVPVTSEGWVTIAVYVLVLTGGVIVVHGAVGRLVLILLLTGGLLSRGRMTAPMRWRWGR